MALGVAPPAARVAEDPPSTSWLQTRLEEGFRAATGGTMRIGRLDVAWTSLTATVEDVTLSIPAEGAPPLTATVGRGRMKLAWSGLASLGGGRIHIASIEAEGATFACSREWIEAFKPRKTRREGGSVEIRVDHLEVKNSVAIYEDRGLGLRIHATQVAYAGDWSLSRRQLIGTADGTASVEAPFLGRAWIGHARGGVRIGLSRVDIFQTRAEGPGAAAELTGTVSWGAGTSFTAEGRATADLGLLRPYLRGDLALAGHAEGPYQIVYTGGTPIRVTVQAATKNVRIGPIATDTARGELTLHPGRLDLARIEARAYGGSFSGSVGLAFGAHQVLETNVIGRAADFGRVVALAGRDLPLSALVDLTLETRGDPAHLETWTGGGTFQATPVASASRLPVGGSGRLRFTQGHVVVDSDAVTMGEARFRLALDAALGEHPVPIRLSLDGTTRDATATQRASLAMLDALGVARNSIASEPVAGTGSIRADVRTSGSAEVDLRLDLSGGSWSGIPFDRAALDLGIDAREVVLRRLHASQAGQSLDLSATFLAGTGGIDRLDVHAKDLDVGPLLRRFGGPETVDGRVDADLAGDSRGGGFAAEGTVSARGVYVGHEILDTVSSPVRVEGRVLVLEDVRTTGQALTAHGSVLYDLDTGRGRVDLEPIRVRLDASRTLADAGLEAGGAIEARGSIALDREGPTGVLALTATATTLDLSRDGLRQVELGDLTGTARLSPQGAEIAVQDAYESAWTFEGFLGWSPSLPISAVLYFNDLVVSAGAALGQSADVRLKGQIQAEGDLTRPKDLEVNGAFDAVTIRVGSRILRSSAPFPVTLESGRFVVGPSRFEGEGAHIELEAGGALEGGAIEGHLAGALDLGVVSALWSDLRGSGAVTFDVALQGTAESPDLRGSVRVADGRLRLIGYPQTLEQIDAEAKFSGETLTLTSFRAYQGGGEVTASGSASFSGLRLADYTLTFDAANVTADFPKGFKGVYEGRITVARTPKGVSLSGRVNVVQGIYARDFDLGGFGGARREFAEDSESPFPRSVFLDIDVVAPGNVWLRNDVAKLEASGQLHLGGELARPEVTGRLSLFPGGTIRYRDVDYRLDYGTLDLTDRTRINPYIDMRGHTRVGSYEIALHVEGTMDHFEYELTSTPPLSPQDIISVLVTGRTMDTFAGTASATAIPADMAAYYFAGLLSSTFGREIRSSLGIDQLEISPLLLKGETDPTARVTIGKKVSDAVKIVFSQDIGTAGKQTYQVVWDSSRRVRVVAESDSQTGLGGEVQYSRQFGGADRSGATARAREASVAAGDIPGPIDSIAARADDGIDRPALLKVAHLEVGSPFDRGAMLSGAERIRQALVKGKHLEAIVRPEAERDPATGGYAIVFKLTIGPPTTIQVVMVGGKGRRAIERTLAAFWRDTPYTIDYWEVAERELLDKLQSEGYYAADVTTSVTDQAAGRVVRYDVDRGKPVKLKAVRFHGVHALAMERVEGQVTSLKAAGFKRRLLRIDVLHDDLVAVRALYRDEGFSHVRIAAPRIALSVEGDTAEVDVDVDEGARVTVHEIAFSEELPDDPDALRKAIPLKEAGAFSPRLLAESEQALRSRFDKGGYPDVLVESHVTLGTATADVEFDVTTGDRKTVRGIDITGNEVTKTRTIAKALTFGVGDLVSRESLLKSQQQLYRTGLFSSVRMTYAPLDPASPGPQKVTVKVEEAPPLGLSVGLGFDREDGPRASFLVGYSNLGGRNVGIALQGLLSQKTRRGQVTFRRRQIFGAATDSLLSFLYEKSLQTGFTEIRDSVSIRLERRPKPFWIRFIRYNIQQVRIADITDDTGAVNQRFQDKLSDIRLGSVGVGLVRDTRDDSFSPTRGGYASIEGNLFAKALGSQASFATVFLRGSVVVGLGRAGRFASYLRVGAEQPFAGTDPVPLSERYFAGGSYTLRGFATDSVEGLEVVVPSLIPGQPDRIFNSGGEALLILNEVYLFPLWKALHGETFLDVGNVYRTIGEFKPFDVRRSAGVGLWLDTPIGPVRAEYGWKLDRKEGESGGAFILAIGALF
jgi:outer membrane protein insertion porin family